MVEVVLLVHNMHMFQSSFTIDSYNVRRQQVPTVNSFKLLSPIFIVNKPVFTVQKKSYFIHLQGGKWVLGSLDSFIKTL